MRKIALLAMLLALIPVQPGATEAPNACDRRCQRSGQIRSFLIDLQKAVQKGDRQKVLAMTRVPLRVNLSAGHYRLYRSKAQILANYDRIFTPKIQKAILAQDPNDIFFRGGDDAMVGLGEIWFNSPCLDQFCQTSGPVTIHAINL